MSSASLLGIAGLALMGAWAATPDFREIPALPEQRDIMDPLSTTEHIYKTSTAQSIDVKVNPAPPGASSNVTGMAPAWLIPLSKDGSKHTNHAQATHQYATKSAKSGLEHQPKGKLPAVNPDRNQACFYPYKVDNCCQKKK